MISNVAVLLFGAAFASTPCADLKAVSFPNTTITISQSMPAGTFTPPAPAAGGQRGGQQQQPAGLAVPDFCRVAAVLRPTPDSEIEIEVWMPANWNGKFQFVGGGGWAGVISYPAMAAALQEGYAT